MDSDFRILGELEVLQDGRPVDLGSPRQKALLARLVVSAGEAVSTDRLIDDLWSATSPDKAKRTLQVYVSRLRKALGDDGTCLEHRGTGYCLATERANIDATRFESLVAEGEFAVCSGDAEAARALLVAALDLWRGSALSEFPDDAFAKEEAMRLEAERILAEEARISADLTLGHHAIAVMELNDLVVRYPVPEKLTGVVVDARRGSGVDASL